MGIHHIALAVRDAKATHEFYTNAMGFRLVKVEVARAGERGFAKHLFYDTGGGGLIAFWDLHDPDLALGEDWTPSISKGLGLPTWTNHLAFDADSLEDLEARKQRWIAQGHDCMEIDHGWCRSIYVRDPNDIMVEFCITTAEMTDEDAAEALAVLQDDSPSLGEPPPIQVFKGAR